MQVAVRTQGEKVDPNSSTQWFATLGVGGIVAAFMFMFYRKDVKQYTDLWKEQSTANASLLAQVMEVVRDNTAALTKVVAVVDSLHRRIDAGPPYPYRSDEEARKAFEHRRNRDQNDANSRENR